MKKKQKGRLPIIVGTCAIVVLMAVSALAVINLLLSDDGNKRRKQIQMITLVKPPPPPKIKEKPPEPEVEKKEEIVEPEPEETPPEQMEVQAERDAHECDDLRCDAERTAGGDCFGLRGKKGARGLLMGGNRSLLQRYAWYTSIIQNELHEEIKALLEEKGGIPKGKHKTQVRIRLDEAGRIARFQIVKPTGNSNVDQAIEAVLTAYRTSEPPPPEMPRTINLAITSSG